MANGDADKALDKWAELGDRSEKIQKDLIARADKIISSESKRLSIAQDLANVAQQITAARKAGNKELEGELKTTEEALKKFKEINKLQDKLSNSFGAINDQAQDLVGNIQGFVESLPGGKALSKAFGIDQLGDAMSKSLNKAAGVMAKGGSAGAAFSAFGSSMMALVNPVTIIAAIIAGLVLTFINFEKKAKGVAEATGLTLAQSKSLVKEAKKVATSLDHQLATSEDILAVQKATISEFGVANMLSAKQAGNVAEIGKSFSIGAEAAAGVTNEFMRMGMEGDEVANALLNVSAEAFKAGVSVGTVTKDIAENAKATAKYFGGNVKALRKAAVEAAKLGVSLQTMANVADGLLKFEDSISAQFEFQAMTGKMINFDKARQLALDGKIAEATQEVLSNVGSLAEFEAMRPLSQRKLAEATGMTVDELTKSMAIQEKLGTSDEARVKAAASLGLSAAELKNMSAEDLANKVAQQQTTDKMAARFSQLTDELTTALIPAGEVFMQIFEMLMPLLKLTGLTFKYIGRILEATIVNPFNNIVKPALEGISDIINGDILDGFVKLGKSILQYMIRPYQIALDLIIGTVNTIIDLINFIPGVDIGPLSGFNMVDELASVVGVGDLGINPNGGPVVMSPNEGGIFQGTSNDGLEMSPTAGPAGSQGSSGAGSNAITKAIAQTNALLQQLIANGSTIEMDGQVVGAVLRTSDSFRRR